ncbi:MAG: hypothetical protein WD824_07180 [Cyclobacteriaceae bacterium]
MQVSKILLVTSIILFASECVYAQRSKQATRSRYHFSTPKVRGQKAKIICPAFYNNKYPFYGLGFKLGDPFALTYKFYPNKRVSLAVDFGKAASGLYNRYFREKFSFYVMEDTFPSTESSLIYLTHRVKSDLIGEVKVLYHVDAKKISDGLQGYAGVGWEWKRTQLKYDYQYNQANNDPQLAGPFGFFERNRVTMGPQVVLGIEYAYFRIPISAFMEVEYFADIQADPGWQRFEGGAGLRYIF